MGKLKTSRWLKLVIIGVVCLAVVGGGYFIQKKRATETSGVNSQNRISEEVARRNIQVKISGTGTVEPISMYNITPLVKGTVLKAPFDEGMEVKKGELLYRIDDSDLLNNIEKTKNSIEKLNLNNQSTVDSLEDLTIYAPFDGRIENLHINEEEEIKSANEKIADIVNDNELKAMVPFNEAQISKMEIGQSAKVMVSGYMTYIDGEVTAIDTIPSSTKNGTSLYNAEITFKNPGIVKAGMKVTANITTRSETIESSSEGEVGYSESQSIYPEITGVVKNVFINNNDWVKSGDKILELENTNLNVSNKKSNLDLEDLQLTLDSQRKQLEDYNITSPIDGIIVKKNFKEGDTINSNTNLMTVVNMDKMIFTVDVDELDIAKIKIGQKAKITADALTDTEFTGEVTKIAVMGSTQSGVTTYPVEVTISEPGKLKPGMNVNAEILVENRKDVLSVPMAAVTKVRDKTYVFIDNGEKGENQDKGTENPKLAGNRREVVVGINNDNYIEIISGVEEGEKIYIPVAPTANMNNNSRRMPSGMGMPSGGGRGRR